MGLPGAHNTPCLTLRHPSAESIRPPLPLHDPSRPRSLPRPPRSCSPVSKDLPPAAWMRQGAARSIADHSPITARPASRSIQDLARLTIPLPPSPWRHRRAKYSIHAAVSTTLSETRNALQACLHSASVFLRNAPGTRSLHSIGRSRMETMENEGSMCPPEGKPSCLRSSRSLLGSMP